MLNVAKGTLCDIKKITLTRLHIRLLSLILLVPYLCLPSNYKSLSEHSKFSPSELVY